MTLIYYKCVSEILVIDWRYLYILPNIYNILKKFFLLSDKYKDWSIKKIIYFYIKYLII